MSSTASEYDKYIEQWKPYLESKTPEARNDIVLAYMDLVKKIVLRFKGSYNSFTQIDDMINQGIIALIDAVERFDPYKNIKFETFATFKIRGAMIDLMRKHDWVSRNQRTLSKELDNVYSSLYAELGREPTKEEMADAMKLTVENLEKILEQRQNSIILSYEEVINEKLSAATPVFTGSSEEPTPEGNVLEKELSQVLAEAISQLNEKEKQVVSLYYYENLKLKEIAEILGITESRVSQIHSASMIKLKQKLTSYQNA